MTIPEMLDILRNPFGYKEELTEAQLMAADLVEQFIQEQKFKRIKQHKI